MKHICLYYLVAMSTALATNDISVTKQTCLVLDRHQGRCEPATPFRERDDQFRTVETERVINPFDILGGGNGTTAYCTLLLYTVC